MKFCNQLTGDVVDMPPPNAQGESVVTYNGEVWHRVLWSDAEHTVTLGDGTTFRSGDEFAAFLLRELENGRQAK